MAERNESWWDDVDWSDWSFWLVLAMAVLALLFSVGECGVSVRIESHPTQQQEAPRG